MNWMKGLGIGLVGLVVGAFAMHVWVHHHQPKITFDTAYQAVLLDTGNVYYGKIEGLGSEMPVLRDVFYIQSQTNPETKQVTSVLVRRGKEFHGPDHMVINARHLVLVEPVGQGSKVAQLIAEQQKQ